MINQAPLAPYRLSLKLRHLLFDHGKRKSVAAEVPTICLGNVTVGGTGKTPHTEMILRMLLEDADWGKKNIAVLSRGYKRKTKRFQQVVSSAKLFGDEPQQIKNKFPQVTVAVDRDRVRGCGYLVHPEKLQEDKAARGCIDKNFPAADIILLDDAFQYRKLKATLNIVLVDYSRPTFNDHLLPIGRLRDLPDRIGAADIIIVSKCPSYLDEWEKENWAKALGLSSYSHAKASGVNSKGREQRIFFTTVEYCAPEAVYPDGDQRYTYSKNLVLFTGIANDRPLELYLSDSYRIVKHLKFADHHKFSSGDIRSIASASKAYPTSVVMTTEKDAQRIAECRNVPERLRQRMFYVPIRVAFLGEDDEALFRQALFSAVSR